ncbi:hypothetical protein KDX37_04310 [Pseudomonas sp. CDFA 601]|nr:hypothetical protein [Pseudomonas californiensis]
MAITHEASMSGSTHTNGQPGRDPYQGSTDRTSASSENVGQHEAAQFEQYREGAAQTIEDLAQNAQSAAEQIDSNDTLGVSHYVNDIAQSMTTLAENLRNKNAEQLLQDAGRLAKENPVLFISASVAIGLGLSRLLKASGTSASTSGAEDSRAASPTMSASGTHGSNTSPSSTAKNQDLSATDSSQPADPISPAALGAEELAATHAHEETLSHSTRSGQRLPDTPNGFTDDIGGDLTRDGLPRSGLPKGDV